MHTLPSLSTEEGVEHGMCICETKAKAKDLVALPFAHIVKSIYSLILILREVCKEVVGLLSEDEFAGNILFLC